MDNLSPVDGKIITDCSKYKREGGAIGSAFGLVADSEIDFIEGLVVRDNSHLLKSNSYCILVKQIPPTLLYLRGR